MTSVRVNQPPIKVIACNPEMDIDNSNVKLVKGDTGAVFTPHVDIESNLSWTNNGGLDNPQTVNIRGRDGVVTSISNLMIETIMEG